MKEGKKEIVCLVLYANIVDTAVDINTADNTTNIVAVTSTLLTSPLCKVSKEMSYYWNEYLEIKLHNLISYMCTIKKCSYILKKVALDSHNVIGILKTIWCFCHVRASRRLPCDGARTEKSNSTSAKPLVSSDYDN
ncbi:hypothetical protein IEQ34_006403 [Dendrobium chrysotoxum]|uniref:Uncharacterized protein n=1 Tax=Dendrobium chrysotoxum TaxID=161865 RepID=A0AAV7HDS0_DENCH|nr:hypothetical protein IEQ34_006403 [Dendrobium chrysotoxum]